MTMHLNVVSARNEIFSGRVTRLFARGTYGELEIAPFHAPLLTLLEPGPIYFRLADNRDEYLFVSGGVLEVQPDVVTILADEVVRAKDLDEMQMTKAKEAADSATSNKKSDFDLSLARSELVRAAAMMQMIKDVRRQVKK